MSAPRYLDDELFAALAERARSAGRRRDHHLFHEADEPCQRLAIGLQPETYIAPHRHLSADKAEGLIVLRGRLGLLIFDEDGQVIETRILAAGGDCVGVDLAPGIFHALVALEPDSMAFECKAGPYRPLADNERAAWAPTEGDAGVADYLQWMRAHFT